MKAALIVAPRLARRHVKGRPIWDLIRNVFQFFLDPFCVLMLRTTVVFEMSVQSLDNRPSTGEVDDVFYNVTIRTSSFVLVPQPPSLDLPYTCSEGL
jgi:hypothetical protein